MTFCSIHIIIGNKKILDSFLWEIIYNYIMLVISLDSNCKQLPGLGKKIFKNPILLMFC